MIRTPPSKWKVETQEPTHKNTDHRRPHAPSRGKAFYTGDYSAFDVALYGVTPAGKRALLAFEIKYSESGAEPSPSRISDQQLALTANSGMFKDPDDPALFSLGLQQLTREHNLAQSMLERGNIDTGCFALAAPRLNHTIQSMGEIYATKLNPQQEGRIGFASFTLERLLEALAGIGMISHAQALHRRYLDFHLIDGELDLAAAEVRSRKRKAKAKGEPIAQGTERPEAA